MSIVAKKLNNFRRKILDLSGRNRMINLSTRSQDNLTIATVDMQKLFSSVINEKSISVSYPKEVQRSVIVDNPDYVEGNEDSGDKTIEADADFYLIKSNISEIEDSKKEEANKARSAYSKLNKLEKNIIPKSVLEHNTGSFSAVYKQKNLDIVGNPHAIYIKLNKIRTSSNSHREEMGSETMFITFGHLKWKESPVSNITLRSPLIIIPISLKDIRSTSSFEFKYTGDNIVYNLSLAKKLRESFNIELPKFNNSTLKEYFDELNLLFENSGVIFDIEKSTSFSILNYLKQSMYEDLTPDKWNKTKKIANHGIINSFFDPEKSFDNPAPVKINSDPLTIEDADSTQISAINSALNGESFILEGPPGTGKSQTITNMIASLIAKDKKVLFVTEKNVAIEVVHNKLIKAGLGDLCINMHSNNANKSNIISALAKKISSPDPIKIQKAKENKRILETSIANLNQYAEKINEYHGKTGMTIHQLLMAAKNLKDKAVDYKINVDYGLLEDKEINHDYLVQLKVFKKNYHETIIKITKDFGDKILGNAKGWQSLDYSNLVAPNVDDLSNGLSTINSINKEVVAELDNSSLKEYSQIISERDIILISNIINTINPDIAKKYCFTIRRLSDGNEFNDQEIKARLENNVSKFESLDNDLKSIIRLSIAGTDNIEDAIDLNKHLSSVGFSSYEEYLLFLSHLDYIDKNKAVLKSTFDNFAINIGGNCKETLPYSMTGILNLVKIIYFYKRLNINNYPYKNINVSKLDYEYIQDFYVRQKELSRLERAISKNYKIKAIKSISLDAIDDLISAHNNKSFFSIFNSRYRESLSIFKRLAKDSEQQCYSKKEMLEIRKYKVSLNEFLSNKDKDLSILSFAYKGEKTKTKEVLSAIQWQHDVKKKIGWNISGNKALSEFIINKNLDFITEVIDSQKLMNILSISRKLNKYFERFPVNGINEYLEKNELTEELIDIKDKINKLDDRDLNIISAYDCDYFNRLSELYFDFKECSEIKEELGYGLFEDIDIFSKHSINSVFKMFNEAKLITSKLNLNSSDYKEKILNIIETESIHDIAKKINNIANKNKKIKELQWDIYSRQNIELTNWYGKNNNLSYADKIKFNDEQLLQKDIFPLLHMLSLQKEKAKWLGIDNLIEKIEQNKSLLNSDMSFIEYHVYSYLVNQVWKENKALKEFSGIEHNNAISSFKEIDKKQKELNISFVKQAVICAQIPEGNKKGKVGEYTERNLIEHHANLQRPNISIRNLFKGAKKALMALKPCIMMSPLSVGKYLPKEAGMFDVLIIDEASQVRPEDALGSIARAKQIIIVGDKKQLPPTNFFSSSNELMENNSTQIEMAESILGGVSSILPTKMLKWHYRSTNESLINFSNQRIYDGKLISFPSPDAKASGIKYHFVSEGFFEAGVNKNESFAIKARLEQMLLESPDLTIGIAAMNVKQSVFLDEIIRNDIELSKLIDSHEKRTGSTVFIKNLENVQGDERDIVIISGTYGRNPETNRLRQGFGPLTRDGGWRRLNVLITRARKKIEFFSSIDFKDVNVTDSSNDSLVKYKEYLEYAKTGVIKTEYKSMGEPDSEFEISVIEKLEKLGYQCVSQVGESGYKIDIGVLNKKGDSFLLGIECDGASYHSSKSARDRDRLRQQVLEGMGWSITRIWSTDWFKDSQRCINDIVMKLKIEEEYKEASLKINSSSKSTYRSTDKEINDLKFIINETLVSEQGEISGTREKYEDANLNYEEIAIGAGHKGIKELEYMLQRDFKNKNNLH